MIEIGMAVAITVVLRKLRRKNNRTRTASNPPKRAALPTFEIELWMYLDESMIGTRVI
jgi:hypothetical protein